MRRVHKRRRAPTAKGGTKQRCLLRGPWLYIWIYYLKMFLYYSSLWFTTVTGCTLKVKGISIALLWPLTVVFCSARGDREKEVRGEGGKSSSSFPQRGIWKPRPMPVHCSSTKAEPNIDFKAQDSSGLGKTRPQCVLDELFCSLNILKEIWRKSRFRNSSPNISRLRSRQMKFILYSVLS